MDHEPDIHPPFEAFYIESMRWHTNAVLDAVKVVGDWIELVVADDERALDLPKEKLLEQLQLIIQHSASLSKYLWPIRSGKNAVHTRRGRRLRSALDTDETSVLKNRRLRDSMEHFDERLDNYLNQNQVGEFVPIDVRAEIPQSDVPLHIFKGFYINPRIFVLLDHQYELVPIVSEVERIHDRLTACVKSGYRLNEVE